MMQRVKKAATLPRLSALFYILCDPVKNSLRCCWHHVDRQTDRPKRIVGQRPFMARKTARMTVLPARKKTSEQSRLSAAHTPYIPSLIIPQQYCHSTVVRPGMIELCVGPKSLPSFTSCRRVDAMLLQQSPEKQQIFPKARLGGTPCDANPGFSEMSSLDEQTSLRGCATKTEGGGVRPQTGVFSSGTTTRTNGDVLTFPEIMGLLDRDEIVSGGESKASRDPDLQQTELDPPLSSAPCPSTPDSSLLFSKGTTRPDSFLDLGEFPFAHGGAHLEKDHHHHDDFILDNLQFDHSGHFQLPPRAFRKADFEVDIRSVASSTTINSTAHTVSIATSPPPLYEEKTFFDTTPSPTGPFPPTPIQIFSSPSSRLLESTPRMVPELSDAFDSRLSSSHSNSAAAAAADAMKNKTKQWRPRSAPKTSNNSGSDSPLQVWPKRSDQQQQQLHMLDNDNDGRRNLDADFFKAVGRDSDDATYVDSVSNHLGKMAPLPPPPTRPGSGDLNSRKEVVKDSTMDIDMRGRGPQPVITREEYEALPQAIQRKVCMLVCLRILSCPVCPASKTSRGKELKCQRLTRER